MTAETIQIEPRVALLEERMLAEHYRNRSLVLSQRVFEAEGIIEQLNARIRDLELQVVDHIERQNAAEREG